MSNSPSHEPGSDAEPQHSTPPDPAELEQGLSPLTSRRRPHILSREEALAGLSQLPKLILAGIVSVPQANSMKGAFTAVIQAHDRSPAQNHIPLENSGVIAEQLREHPELANSLAEILPQGIIDRMMEGYHDE